VYQEYRDSDCRRWKLHQHIPFTKKVDKYLGKTPEVKWVKFHQPMDEYTRNGLEHINYLSIDIYELVGKEKRLTECVNLVLPNIN